MSNPVSTFVALRALRAKLDACAISIRCLRSEHQPNVPDCAELVFTLDKPLTAEERTLLAAVLIKQKDLRVINDVLTDLLLYAMRDEAVQAEGLIRQIADCINTLPRKAPPPPGDVFAG